MVGWVSPNNVVSHLFEQSFRVESPRQPLYLWVCWMFVSKTQPNLIIHVWTDSNHLHVKRSSSQNMPSPAVPGLQGGDACLTAQPSERRSTPSAVLWIRGCIRVGSVQQTILRHLGFWSTHFWLRWRYLGPDIDDDGGDECIQWADPVWGTLNRALFTPALLLCVLRECQIVTSILLNSTRGKLLSFNTELWKGSPDV